MFGGIRTAGIRCPPGAPASQPPSPAIAKAAAISFNTRRRSCGDRKRFGQARKFLQRRAQRTTDRPPTAPSCAIVGSSVTYRAIRQVAAANMILAPSALLASGCVRCSLPFGVVDLVLRPQMRAGIAMTVQAESHGERLGLVAKRHAIHLPVTSRAADALGDVNAVVEIDIIRQVVDPVPDDRLSSARLCRTGARIAALVQICEWHVMQV